MDLGSGLEAIRPWLGTGGILGCLGFAARMWVVNRRLAMEEKKDDRQGYGELIEAMQKQIAALGRELVEVRNQLLECRDEHAAAKRQAKELSAQVDGLHRQIVMHSAATAVAIGSAASTPSMDAARRILEGSDDT
jgi:hypothetical protein